MFNSRCPEDNIRNLEFIFEGPLTDIRYQIAGSQLDTQHAVSEHLRSVRYVCRDRDLRLYGSSTVSIKDNPRGKTYAVYYPGNNNNKSSYSCSNLISHVFLVISTSFRLFKALESSFACSDCWAHLQTPPSNSHSNYLPAIANSS